MKDREPTLKDWRLCVRSVRFLIEKLRIDKITDVFFFLLSSNSSTFGRYNQWQFPDCRCDRQYCRYLPKIPKDCSFQPKDLGLSVLVFPISNYKFFSNRLLKLLLRTLKLTFYESHLHSTLRLYKFTIFFLEAALLPIYLLSKSHFLKLHTTLFSTAKK